MRSLADVKRVGFNIVRILPTNAVREGGWLTIPLDYADGEAPSRPHLLIVNKSMAEDAQRLYPDATSSTPTNMVYARD